MRKSLLLLAALLIGMAWTPLADRLIIFPTTGVIDPRGAHQQLVPFENGHLQIWTGLSPEAESKGSFDIALLRFYGNADRAEHWVAAESRMWPGRAQGLWRELSWLRRQ